MGHNYLMDKTFFPRILECTLRDGSYANNFQFTKRDTFNIVRALDIAGFELIETGHGMGLGASEMGKEVAAETDESYMQATAEAVKDASWGMFCIPGIAKLNHLDIAKNYNMDFVRIGTNVESYKQSQPFIERAKKHGMFVCSNFMKSYLSTPNEFAQYALEVEKFGSDLVYIVDSAGGMFPDDLERYVNAIREKSSTLRLGFHGHHNIGLGVANALKAAELKVDVIDTSLQGFGRSTGNTPTEQFICTLIRRGYPVQFDLIEVMDIAEKYIQPHITNKGISTIDIVAGFSLFHSSYMPIIEKYSKMYGVDPRRLIMAVCIYNQVEISHELVDSQAKLLSKQGAQSSWKAAYLHYIGGEQEAIECEE